MKAVIFDNWTQLWHSPNEGRVLYEGRNMRKAVESANEVRRGPAQVVVVFDEEGNQVYNRSGPGSAFYLGART